MKNLLAKQGSIPSTEQSEQYAFNYLLRIMYRSKYNNGFVYKNNFLGNIFFLGNTTFWAILCLFVEYKEY